MIADRRTWRSVRDELLVQLQAAGLVSAAVDARRIVEEVSGHSGTELAAHLDEPATRLGSTRAAALGERRAAGEPLQYVVGSWGFRSLDLFVDPRVLIPRPETEVVAECALAEADRIRAAGLDRLLVAVDLGTGSGAIALSLAVERPWIEVVATDVAGDALAVARANLAGIGRPGARVELRQGRWFEALSPERRGAVDLIVSNPPYVAIGDELPAEVREWEPTGALIAGPRGTEDLEVLVDGADQWLVTGGALVLEVAPHQAAEMAERARRRRFDRVEVVADLAGRSRVVVARRR
jgi:release factor glutamine methyltransferase